MKNYYLGYIKSFYKLIKRYREKESRKIIRVGDVIRNIND